MDFIYCIIPSGIVEYETYSKKSQLVFLTL